jgi:trehalose 6-phosphate synthase
VAKYLKQRRPDLRIALFWHIPWPNAEVFRRLPWRAELLDGLLANDLLGFHIRLHALNFLQSVADTHESRVDHERMAIERSGQRTYVRDVPISVDVEEISALSEAPANVAAAAALRAQLGVGDGVLGLGVDRMDYTKGIPERLESLERLLEKEPAWIGRLQFVQIGVPSRIELEEYRAVASRTRALVERINQRFSREDRPVVTLIEENLEFRELLAWYRAADVCAVTSLHDGMNLVAKEYVAARTDLDGALVLSPFTGAARELERAWVVSPYDREALADTLHAAFVEPREARRERMKTLRQIVTRRTIFDWAIEMLDGATHLAAAVEEIPPAGRATRRRPAAARRKGARHGLDVDPSS